MENRQAVDGQLAAEAHWQVQVAVRWSLGGQGLPALEVRTRSRRCLELSLPVGMG